MAGETVGPMTEAGRQMATVLHHAVETRDVSWLRFASDDIDAAVGRIESAARREGWDAALADHERLAQAIHDSGIAACRVECAEPIGGEPSGADHDFATLLIRAYSRLGERSNPEVGLEEAWARVGALLPEGWVRDLYDYGPPGPYNPGPGEEFHTPRYQATAKLGISSGLPKLRGRSDESPAAALLDLAARLAEVKP